MELTVDTNVWLYLFLELPPCVKVTKVQSNVEWYRLLPLHCAAPSSVLSKLQTYHKRATKCQLDMIPTSGVIVLLQRPLLVIQQSSAYCNCLMAGKHVWDS